MALSLKYIIETNLIRVRYVVLYKLLQDGTLIVIKVGVLCVGVIRMSWHLKEELAWATDKWLQVNSNIMLFKTVIPLGN